MGLASDFDFLFSRTCENKLRELASCLTFDDVSNVMILADKRSINGALDSQLRLHRFGVTLQVSVRLSRFVDIELIILRVQSIKGEKLNSHGRNWCVLVCVFCCLSP